MAVIPIRRLGLVVALLAPLGGCDEMASGSLISGFGAAAPSGAASDAPERVAGQVRVVEAADIFDVTETGLWDGRPSLGLIWVAYEGADPSNVIIRNQENGQFVVGALYRRERFFPGPPFQLSSDAAAELGILAGAPARIRVTALVEERIAPPEPEPEPELEAEAGVQIAEVGEATPADIAPESETDALVLPAPDADVLDPIAAAAAAIAAADPGGETAAADQVLADPEPVIPPRRPTIEGPNAPLPRRVAETAVPEPTEAEPEALVVSEPLENPIPTPTPEVSSLSRPFIQVGIFSVFENAQSAAQMLADAGIIPLVEEQRIGGRTLFRVVVGPARDIIERATLLKQVQDQGFADAYFVSN